MRPEEPTKNTFRERIARRLRRSLTRSSPLLRRDEPSLLKVRRFWTAIVRFAFPLAFFAGFGLAEVAIDAVASKVTGNGKAFQGVELPILLGTVFVLTGVPILYGYWRIARVNDVLARIVFAPGKPRRRYVLYLRSYFVDETLRAGNVSGNPLMLSSGDNESFQARLARVLPTHEIIKIGSRLLIDWPGGTLRTSKASWIPRFLELAESADLIVMTPITRSSDTGTFLEIRELVARRWLDKTILIAPPNSAVRPQQGRFWKKEKIRALWEKSRAIVKAELGLEIPPYPGGSAIFSHADGRWQCVFGISGRKWYHPRALQALLLDGLRSQSRRVDAGRFAKHLVFYRLFLPGFLILGALESERSAAEQSSTQGAAAFAAYVMVSIPSFFGYCRRFSPATSRGLPLFAAGIAGVAVSSMLVFSYDHLIGGMLLPLRAIGGEFLWFAVFTSIILLPIWGTVALVALVSLGVLRSGKPQEREALLGNQDSARGHSQGR